MLHHLQRRSFASRRYCTHPRRLGSNCLLLAASAALTACATVPADAADLGSVTFTTEDCIQPTDTTRTGLFAALLGLVIPKVVEGGVKFVGTALAKAGAPEETHLTSTRPDMLYALAAVDKLGDQPPQYDVVPNLAFRHRCVVTVAGPRRTGAGDSALIQAATAFPMANANGLKSDFQAKISEVFDPSRTSVLVIDLQPSPDTTAFRLVPKYISIGGALKDRRIDKARSAVWTVSLLPPGGTDEGAATTVRMFGFPQVGPSTTLTGTAAEAKAGGWIPLPALPEAAQARLSAALQRRSDANALADIVASSKNPAEVAKAKKSRDELISKFIAKDNIYLTQLAPMTFRVDFVETVPGNKLLVALGEFLSGNAKELAAPISAAVDPTARAASAEAEAANEDTLRIAAITDATALASARTGSDASATRIAQIKAAASCRRLEAAGFSDPACVTVH